MCYLLENEIDDCQFQSSSADGKFGSASRADGKLSSALSSASLVVGNSTGVGKQSETVLSARTFLCLDDAVFTELSVGFSSDVNNLVFGNRTWDPGGILYLVKLSAFPLTGYKTCPGCILFLGNLCVFTLCGNGVWDPGGICPGGIPFLGNLCVFVLCGNRVWDPGGISYFEEA